MKMAMASARVVAGLVALGLVALGVGCKDDKGGDGASSDQGEMVVTAPEAKLTNHKVSVLQGEYSTLPYSANLKDGTAKFGGMIRIYLSDGPITKVQPAEDKTLIYLGIIGKEGSKADEPLPTGTYKSVADGFVPADKHFMTAYEFGITPPKASGGKKVSESRFEGTIELTKSDGKEVAGKLDIKKGETTIKGSFSAKLRQ